MKIWNQRLQYSRIEHEKPSNKLTMHIWSRGPRKTITSWSQKIINCSCHYNLNQFFKEILYNLYTQMKAYELIFNNYLKDEKNKGCMPALTTQILNRSASRRQEHWHSWSTEEQNTYLKSNSINFNVDYKSSRRRILFRIHSYFVTNLW